MVGRIKTGPITMDAGLDNIRSKLNAIIAPTVNDDSADGYTIGSVWVDVTADKAYRCVDNTLGAAVWKETTIVAGGGGDMLASTYDPANISEQLVGLVAVQPLTNKTLDDDTNFIHADAIHLRVRNVSGSTMPIGSVVYASGYNSGEDRIEIELSDADDFSTMPVIGVLDAELLNNANGECIGFGVFDSLDTSAFTVGDILYASTTPGVWTNVKPTGSGELIQAIAKVLRSHASLGRVLVQGAGRVNELPNDVASSDAVIDTITETTHGFVVGNQVYFDGTNWVKAQADSLETLADGVVKEVTDANTFVLQILGSITLTTGEWDAITGETGGLTFDHVTGPFYFLDSATAGKLTLTEPVISAPMLKAVSTTEAYVLHQRPSMRSGENIVPAFHIYKDTTQSNLATSTYTVISFGVTRHDTANGVDLANNKYVVPVAGKYRFDVCAYVLEIGSGKLIEAAIKVNSTTYNISRAYYGSTSMTVSNSLEINCDVGDEIFGIVWSNTVNAADCGGGSNTWMTGHRIGP